MLHLHPYKSQKCLYSDSDSERLEPLLDRLTD